MKKIKWLTFLAGLCLLGCLFLFSCGKCEHVYDNFTVISKATCTEKGVKEFKCTKCGEIKTVEEEAKGHFYKEKTTEVATCTSEGVKTFRCECGDKYTESYSMRVYTADEIFTLAECAVGEILTYSKSGSELSLGTGIVLSSDGKILTNYHVIEGAYSAKITIEDVTYTVQRVLAYDKETDLAVLKISADYLKTLPICKSPLQVGRPVYALGSSKGLTATFSQGIITSAKRVLDGVTYVQHDAAISAGNSGGPLINEYGEIVGINTKTVQDSQNLNFAIFASEMDRLWYGTPITMSEFYNRTTTPYEKMVDFIIHYGTWNSSTEEYALTLYSGYVDGHLLERYAFYSPEVDMVVLVIRVDIFIVYLIMDEADGKYQYMWGESETDYYAVGNVDANALYGLSMFDVISTNIQDPTLMETARELACAMMKLLVKNINTDFAGSGVTAASLGFARF